MESIKSMSLCFVASSFFAWGAWGCSPEEVIDRDETLMYPSDSQDDEETSDSENQDSENQDSENQDSENQDSENPDSAEDTGDEPIDFDCADWSTDQADMETLIGAAINERRESGFECAGVTYPPVEPLHFEGILGCAARYHSLDMAINDFVSVMGSNGDKASDLMEEFGYTDWGKWAAVVSAGRDEVAEIVDSLMTKESQCISLLHKDLTDIGVGVAFVEDSTYGWYTTVLLGDR